MINITITEGEAVKQLRVDEQVTYHLDEAGKILSLDFEGDLLAAKEWITKFLNTRAESDGKTIKLEATPNLHVRELNIGFQSSIDTARRLLIKGFAITEGVHNGDFFPASTLEKAVSKFPGTAIAVRHQFNKGGDKKGQIENAEFVNNGILISGVLDDQPTIEQVQNGELHSFSIQSTVDLEQREDAPDIITELINLIETTLTPDPADVAAIVTETKEVLVPILLEQEQKEETITKEQPPLAVVQVQPSTELKGDEILENEAEEVKTEQAVSPAEFTELKKQLEAFKGDLTRKDEVISGMIANKRVDDARTESVKLVTDKKIGPAQQASAENLIASLAEHQRGAWDEFIKNSPGIQPLGTVELDENGGAGMVANTPQTANVDVSQLSPQDLETYKLALMTEEWEKRGFYGKEHQRKHIEGDMVGLYPKKGVEQ